MYSTVIAYIQFSSGTSENGWKQGLAREKDSHFLEKEVAVEFF